MTGRWALPDSTSAGLETGVTLVQGPACRLRHPVPIRPSWSKCCNLARCQELATGSSASHQEVIERFTSCAADACLVLLQIRDSNDGAHVSQPLIGRNAAWPRNGCAFQSPRPDGPEALDAMVQGDGRRADFGVQRAQRPCRGHHACGCRPVRPPQTCERRRIHGPVWHARGRTASAGSASSRGCRRTPQTAGLPSRARCRDAR